MTQRTGQQNKAIHLLCEWWAEGLQNGGHDMRAVVKIPIRPTKENVKSDIVIPFIESRWPELKREDGTFHTSDLSTTQVDELYEAINTAFDMKFDFSVPFPCLESQKMDALAK